MVLPWLGAKATAPNWYPLPIENKAQQIHFELIKSIKNHNRIASDSLAKVAQAIQLTTLLDSICYFYSVGTYYYTSGKNDQGLEYLLTAQILAEPYAPSRLYSQLLLAVGNNHYYLKSLEDALEYFKLVIESDSSSGSQLARAHSNTAAILHEFLVVTNSAAKDSIRTIMALHYEQALNYAELYKDTNQLKVTLSVMIPFYSEFGDIENAKKMATRAIEISTVDGDSHQLAFITIKVCGILKDEGNYQAATDTIAWVVDYFRAVGNEEQMNHALSYQADAYYELGDFKNAFHVKNEQYDFIRDHFNDKIAEKAAAHRVQFEADKKDLIIAKREAALAAEKARQAQYLGAFGIALLLITGLALFFILRQRAIARARRDAELVQQKQENLRATIMAQEAERERIGQDLHDGVCQMLAGLKMQQSQLLQDTGHLQIGLQTSLEKSLSIATDTYDEVRSISHQLTPYILNKTGLKNGIQECLNTAFPQSSKTRVEFSYLIEDDILHQELQSGIYRIVQELTNNTVKHADATLVNLSIAFRKKYLVMIYTDNGQGTEQANSLSGIGMQSMLSRVSYHSGNLDVTTSPGSGFSAVVRVPVFLINRE